MNEKENENKNFLSQTKSNNNSIQLPKIKHNIKTENGEIINKKETEKEEQGNFRYIIGPEQNNKNQSKINKNKFYNSTSLNENKTINSIDIIGYEKEIKILKIQIDKLNKDLNEKDKIINNLSKNNRCLTIKFKELSSQCDKLLIKKEKQIYKKRNYLEKENNDKNYKLNELLYARNHEIRTLSITNERLQKGIDSYKKK